MTITIGSDHAGFLLKETLVKHLKNKGIQVTDMGPFNEDRVDYPDFGHAVANSISKNENTFGILICGSGIGISITANKHKNIRAALCWNDEITKLSRQHNNANILCLPARFITDELAIKCIDVFLSTPFEGGRHTDRVNKIEL